MRYFDAFTGIGGFTLAINRAYANIPTSKREEYRGAAPASTYAYKELLGTKQPTCVGFSEVDKYAASVYQHHYPTHTNYGDITKIDADALPDFDLLCGGFPCQAFSIAGKRAGFADTRGTLFFDLARIARAKRPRLLLFENVKGLLSHEDGRTFYTIISTLDELGYDLQWQVLNSKDFGVPQNRERVFIVGHLRGTPRPQVFPFIGTPRDIAEEHTRSEPMVIGSSQKHATVSTSGIVPCLSSAMGMGGGQTPMVSAPTIRRLTPIECERLQGFPDNWTATVSDSQRYKQCGNAVTVNVVQSIVERLIQGGSDAI